MGTICRSQNFKSFNSRTVHLPMEMRADIKELKGDHAAALQHCLGEKLVPLGFMGDVEELEEILGDPEGRAVLRKMTSFGKVFFGIVFRRKMMNGWSLRPSAKQASITLLWSGGCPMQMWPALTPIFQAFCVAPGTRMVAGRPG
ncbi:uncharacterized protein LOC144096766 isoform X1 [Amblyomma americanum]